MRMCVMSFKYPVTGRYSVIYGNPFLLFRKRKGEGMNATPNLQGIVPFNGKTDLLTPFTFIHAHFAFVSFQHGNNHGTEYELLFPGVKSSLFPAPKKREEPANTPHFCSRSCKNKDIGWIHTLSFNEAPRAPGDYRT